jgi:hypothetical protein
MKKLTGEEVRALRKQARCPDCASTVTINRRTRIVGIQHSDTCLMARRIHRAGLTISLAPSNGTSPYTQVPPQ